MTKLDAGLITPLPTSDSGSAAVWGSKKSKPSTPVLFVSDLEWIPIKRRQSKVFVFFRNNVNNWNSKVLIVNPFL